MPESAEVPASITKIMTLLLTFEALDQGKIKLEDPVTVSAYASSMGGSQVFLAENEVQTLETMIKCIAVASGNDASVAVAEYIAGSEEAFVEQMNAKGGGAGHGGYPFRGLLRPDGFRRPLYDSHGCGRYVQGAYGESIRKYLNIPVSGWRTSPMRPDREAQNSR